VSFVPLRLAGDREELPTITIGFVCPACHAQLRSVPAAYHCTRCPQEYPIVCGIPDFRLLADPYISIEDDRRKGERLFDEAQRRTFESLVHYYYSITPEDPPDLAARWAARAAHEVEIAASVLRRAPPSRSALLDIGCSTGALLIAAKESHAPLVGVDIAFRWLVVGQHRLRENGTEAMLVCANAEHLPFDAASFHLITATDVIEHVADLAAAVREAARVAAPGARLIATANNRYAPMPEPNVHIWGVGYLPRSWQPRYVALRRRDLHPYRIRLRSPRELKRMFRGGGWSDVQIDVSELVAPHAARGIKRVLRFYNRLALAPVIQSVLKWTAPRLRIRAVR
jgi:ubiquinone/menaquinone biosynthesis C-methylase UbiE/uncharacterized protein YbaR (Trm112 family)